MALSNNSLSYEGLRTTCDQALSLPKGLRVTLESRGKAVNMRQRFYKMRELDREQSCKIYGPDDPRYNTSVYDGLVVELEEMCLLIKPESASFAKVEPL